jgi:hypothetical protein
MINSKLLKIALQAIKVFLIIFMVIGCKKSTNDDKTEISNVKKTEELVQKPIEKSKNTSFTISCGSGCAMIYYEQNIVSNEVTFKVETYINEVLSEENLETYIIECDVNGLATKVYLKGDKENILESELPMMKEEFQKYGNNFCSKNNIKSTNQSEDPDLSDVDLIYDKKIDIKSVKYEILTERINGIEKFLCEYKKIRYIQLPKKNKVNLILVPQDCGDFAYRFYLLTIFGNKVVSNQYVEGEWYEPGDDDSYKEMTSFKIDKNYKIEVITNAVENGQTTLKEKKYFEINNQGVLNNL